MASIKLAVKDFALPLIPEGGITFGSAKGRWVEQGIVAHQLRQESNSSDPSYQSEISLSISQECDGFTVQLQGRADGVFTGESEIVIEEIKSCFSLRNQKRDLKRFENHP